MSASTVFRSDFGRPFGFLTPAWTSSVFVTIWTSFFLLPPLFLMSDVFLCKTRMSIFCMSNVLFVFVFFVSSLVFICVECESRFDIVFCVILLFIRYVC